MKLPPPKVIAVDVDGTLSLDGRPNPKAIAYCEARKAEGYSLTLWSARGESYARQTAEAFGVVSLFDHILSKPGYILDDLGWGWIKFTVVIRRMVA